LDPNNIVILSNRAQCFLCLERWEEAIRDCNKAILANKEQQLRYPKVYVRRAIAYRHLENYSLSLVDFETALQMDPKNEYLQKEVLKAKELLQKSLSVCFNRPNTCIVAALAVIGTPN